MSDTLPGTSSAGGQRRQIIVAESNASVPIPEWAQNGKGLLYVSGCGGGASGSVWTSGGSRGSGGGAGGFGMDVQIPIPAGETAVSVLIGAGAPGVVAPTAVEVPGANGGNTVVTVGTRWVTFEGGKGGVNYQTSGAGGVSCFGDVPAGGSNSGPLAGSTAGLNAPPSWFGRGADGGRGVSPTFGSGARSMFGAGGGIGDAPPAGRSNGKDANSGFGGGGEGATRGGVTGTAGTATSGAGAPGVAILEFVETSS